MAEFLLAVHYVEGQAPPDEETMQRMYADVEALNEQMRQDEVWVFAGGLQTPDQAWVVQEADGDVVTTDGPFAEAKEQLGGFWVLEVPDRATAMDWARRATVACRGPVEVRPFQVEPEE